MGQLKNTATESTKWPFSLLYILFLNPEMLPSYFSVDWTFRNLCLVKEPERNTDMSEVQGFSQAAEDVVPFLVLVSNVFLYQKPCSGSQGKMSFPWKSCAPQVQSLCFTVVYRSFWQVVIINVKDSYPAILLTNFNWHKINVFEVLENLLKMNIAAPGIPHTNFYESFGESYPGLLIK